MEVRGRVRSEEELDRVLSQYVPQMSKGDIIELTYVFNVTVSGLQEDITDKLNKLYDTMDAKRRELAEKLSAAGMTDIITSAKYNLTRYVEPVHGILRYVYKGTVELWVHAKVDPALPVLITALKWIITAVIVALAVYAVTTTLYYIDYYFYLQKVTSVPGTPSITPPSTPSITPPSPPSIPSITTPLTSTFGEITLLLIAGLLIYFFVRGEKK